MFNFDNFNFNDPFQTSFKNGFSDPFFKNASFDSFPDFSFKKQQDLMTISKYPMDIISGYLNLENSEGWHEGGFESVGAAFSRYILTKYTEEFGNDEPVLKQAVNAFNDIEKEKTIFSFEPDGHRPTKSRACYDPGVTGWQKHRIARMVGNLGSSYDPNKPFFEILVNSQSTAEDPLCTPFFVSIYENEEELEKRRNQLISLEKVPSKLAKYSYYPSYAKKPDEYLKDPNLKLGPNSTRILEALVFLQNAQLRGQKSGNCWIKQPMRCILASLYIELVTKRPHMTNEDAWREAIDIYKRIQKNEAIPYIEQLLNDVNISNQMRKSANEALAHQKNL